MVAVSTPLLAATWYVRPDGGTRYSTKRTDGQCDGTADAPYRGHGTNQHCAFSDVRSLWSDGSYNYGASTGFPSYGWIGHGGDTYLIHGSIASGVSYRVGWDNPVGACDAKGCKGVPGDPYGSGAPAPPSGTADQHTRILGENYQSCHARSARTSLHGGYGTTVVLQLAGSSYVDVACLDITDHSSCVKGFNCNTSPGTLSDYALVGIAWSNTSTHDTVTDVRIHGMSVAGMSGPTGDDVVMDHLDLIGNAGSGWNADAGNGTTGTGKLTVRNYNISWNGCSEEYPIQHALPYVDCKDDNNGGYGDGFGTASMPSNPGWQATFDQGIVSYNTQDGLDALHLIGTGSSMTVTHTVAYGNMGQQLKVGGAGGVMRNNVIYNNCNALREAIPGTPPGYNAHLSDFCRAADTAVVMSVTDGSKTVYDNNILFTASATGLQISVNGTCAAPTCQIEQNNNIFIGFRNDKQDGYANGGTGELPNPLFVDEAAVHAYRNPGSSFDHNVTFHARPSSPCPDRQLHEAHAICADPHLPDETWHNYGVPDVSPMPAGAAADIHAPTSGAAHGESLLEVPGDLPSRRKLIAGGVVGGAVLVGTTWVGLRRLRGDGTSD